LEVEGSMKIEYITVDVLVHLIFTVLVYVLLMTRVSDFAVYGKQAVERLVVSADIINGSAITEVITRDQ